MSHEAVVKFLVARFGGDEFRRLIYFNYPEVVAELPGATASLIQVAHTCVQVLDRHGQIDAPFFGLLRRVRSQFVRQIDDLEREWSAVEIKKRPGSTTEVGAPTSIGNAPKPQKSGRSPLNEMPAYRWLHLSDIHFGCRGQEQWVQVAHDFEQSLDTWLGKIGPLDLVLVTGDLTNRGLPAEFEGISRFLDGVLERIANKTGVRPVLIAVPGNHDLVRPADEALLDYAAYDRYVQLGDSQAQRLHDRLWTSRNPDRVAGLFANYKCWMDTYLLPKLAASGTEVRVHSSFFPGDLTVVVDLPGRFPLALVGLNSAWLQYQDGDFEGNLALPSAQFHAALPCDGVTSPLALFDRTRVHRAMLMHHHPPSWLAPKFRDAYAESIYRPDRFSVCLFGHMHHPSAQKSAVDGGENRCFFQAPSLFGLEHYGTKHETRLFGYAFGMLREDGEARLWPLRSILKGDGVPVLERAPNFHWKDDKYVSLRRGDNRRWNKRSKPAT